MRLSLRDISLALCLLAAAACGAGSVPSGSGNIYPSKNSPAGAKKPSHPMPWTSAEVPDFEALEGSGGTNCFVAHVDKDGTIHLGEAVVTEEEYLTEAKKALETVPDVVAVLLIESGMMQGIHLSAELSGIGYKNVQIYYPTTTVHDKNKK
jgi:hypothetical protein